MINSLSNQPNRSHVDEAILSLLSCEINQKENVIILQITTLSNQALNQNNTSKEKLINSQNVNGESYILLNLIYVF